MSEDMSEMFQKMSEMLKNNEIPDNIKSIMNNLAGSQVQSQSQSSQPSQSAQSSQPSQSNQSSQSFNQSSFDSQTQCNSDSSSSFAKESNRNFNGNVNSSFDNSSIDLETMLKMKSIIDSMKSQQNDPRANLLRSLKPYLKPSRKEKVEQYIKLFSMGKVFEVLNPLGGKEKNDV